MIKKGKVTIHDIARESGVSPSTVSRVLNKTASVSIEKEEAVLAAVNRLNYRPSIIAQGLAWGRSTVVGVLTQDISSPFFGEMLQGIERGLHGSGYQAMFASGHWQVNEELEIIDRFMRRQAAGIIVIVGSTPDSHLLQLAEQLPLIVLGRSIKELEDHCLYVDNFQGAYQATKHLVDLGHERIGHITGIASHRDTIDRRRGYSAALTEAGLTVDDNLIVEGAFTEQSGVLAIETFVSRSARFTALFAANDQMAHGARLALYRRGIRVPEDISIVGFDDQPASAYSTPPLTTIRQPTSKMGEVAATAILNLVDEKPFDLPTLPIELVVRESTTIRR